jgi:uncharacterized protein (TIGR00725 family)
MNRKRIISIAGRRSDSKKYNDELAKAAFEAGRIVAKLGHTVLTGGLSGVMEQAARGAKSVGGLTVGILPSLFHRDANPYIDVVLPSGLGIIRNSLVASGADLMIALPGGTGTLEEICFALDYGRPVLSWGSWEIDGVQKIPYPDLTRLEETIVEQIRNIEKREIT